MILKTNANTPRRIPMSLTRAKPKIIYTKTDEAPMLATYSFLPIIQAFAKTAGVKVELSDISLSRADPLSQFPEYS
jgi:isocitrate dehydrogenase